MKTLHQKMAERRARVIGNLIGRLIGAGILCLIVLALLKYVGSE